MEEQNIVSTHEGSVQSGQGSPATKQSMLKLPVVPPGFEGQRSMSEKFAIAGVVAGGISLVSWVIIILGLTVSITGIVCSVLGMKSQHSTHARVGLALSVVGLLAALFYAFAASQGMINSSYFTTEILN